MSIAGEWAPSAASVGMSIAGEWARRVATGSVDSVLDPCNVWLALT
jgi:hypothetical protein